MNENEEIDSTWNQMERRVKGDGFREGTFKGQEDGIAHGFDHGYAEGLRLGKTIGAENGKVQLRRFLKKSTDTPEHIKVQSHCEICVRQPGTSGKAAMPDSIEQVSFEDLKVLQHARTEKLLHEFQNSPPSSTSPS